MDPATIAAIAQMAQQMQQQSFQGGFEGGAGGDIWGALGSSPLGTISPGFAGIAGFMSGKKAKKKQKKLRQRIEQQRNATPAIFGKGLGQQEALTRHATQQRLGGFELAKKAAQQAAQGSKRQLHEREQQLGGRLSQGLTNRGLGSTSVGANMNRGLAADTSRQFSGIDEALGQYFGNLAMGRAGIEAGGTEALGELAAQRSNFDIQNAN